MSISRRKAALLLALPLLALAAWAASREQEPTFIVQRVVVVALPVRRQHPTGREPDTQVNLVVRFNNSRPFWQRGTTSWACEVGYIWWADERGGQHETIHQSAGCLSLLDRNHYLITYECRLRDVPIPQEATEVSIRARVVVNNKHVLPVSVVTRRRVGHSLQVVG